MILKVRCWCCDTVYNYSKTEYCPVCESHWTDVSNTPDVIEQITEPGDRVSVELNWEQLKMSPVL